MMLKRSIVLGTWLLLLPLAQADVFHQKFNQGTRAYRAGDVTNAVSAFSDALAAADTNESEAVSRTQYNLATAMQAAGNAEEALSLYDAAMQADGLELQHHARYNSGNLAMQQAQALEAQEQLEPAKAQTEKAMASYEQALQLQPGDVRSKHNYELAYNKYLDLKEKIEQQQQEQSSDNEENDSEDQDDKQKQEDQKKSEDQQPPENEPKDDGSQDEKPGEDEAPQDPPQDDENQDAQQNPNENPADQPPESQQGAEPKELTPEEAKMILDSMRDEEQANRDKARVLLGRPVPVEKDW